MEYHSPFRIHLASSRIATPITFGREPESSKTAREYFPNAKIQTKPGADYLYRPRSLERR